MKKKNQVELLNRHILATLITSDVGKKDKEYFGVTSYRRELHDGSWEDYRKFYTLKGEGLKIALKELALQGLNGKISAICGQGIHNNSKVLDFGKEFEIELQKVNGKISAGAIRKSGQTKMRSSVSQSEAESALDSISVESIKG